MVEEEEEEVEARHMSDDHADVCSSNYQLLLSARRGVLSKDFSEEECVLILEDEAFEQQQPSMICELGRTRLLQSVRLFKEYQGEDFSHYLPDPIDPIDSSAAKSKIHVKRRRSSSTMPDIKGTASSSSSATSKPCRLPGTPPSRPKHHGLRHLLRHLANSLPPKKRTNKMASNSGGIHAFSFTDSKIGCPHPTDSSDVLHLHTLEPDIRCAEGSLPVENRMFENGSVTSRRSSHSNNFTLVSRRSQSVSNVTDHVTDAALQATPTCQSTGPQATPTGQRKAMAAQATPMRATASQTTPTCQLISRRCSGTREYPDAVKSDTDDAVKEESFWKRMLSTFQKGVERQRRSYRRPIDQSQPTLDVTDK